jgi:hypothetical protein
MPRSQYRIALYDERGQVIRGAAYTHVTEETPTAGLQINLPRGTWFVHEVVAEWDEDPSSRLLGGNPPVVGTLICRRVPPSK